MQVTVPPEAEPSWTQVPPLLPLADTKSTSLGRTSSTVQPAAAVASPMFEAVTV
ncbi:MAG: hypothetical protein BWY91_03299 [bacterium ADurb.BinA028]|nr:MAG: hypothetical protein BWY91_03299 [bacterium ADurb.BinA028]